ncbi:hypothetical protein O181_035116 [Austropuccinia psidii MF-1]|uniref:Uncharacterized protein n=1 Tax=Austropuccinia psidii MF-1 TaxID=1389203 RepID=A0A9Q3H8N4_9BASI|nr:hypothetical protein [Austropuccinia psidii MF-1]
MYSEPPSCPSTPIALNNTLPCNPAQMQSWVWLYFSNVKEKYMEFHVMNWAGKSCAKKIKSNHTSSTKGFKDATEIMFIVAQNIPFILHFQFCPPLIYYQINFLLQTTSIMHSSNLRSFSSRGCHHLSLIKCVFFHQLNIHNILECKAQHLSFKNTCWTSHRALFGAQIKF